MPPSSSTPGNPGVPQLGIPELAAGIEEAHKAGVLVAAHAHAPQGITNAIAAGVDTIEHAAFADDDNHKQMIDAGVTLVPTVTALNPIAEGIGIPAATVAKSLKAREIYRANTAKAIAAGVRIAAGTDAGTALNPIGGLLDELIMYADRGMSATEALRAATVTAGTLVLERGLYDLVGKDLTAMGHHLAPPSSAGVGGFQAIAGQPPHGEGAARVYRAGSDHRKDGQAAGF